MSKKHFLALDSWRGICALLVAIHHLVGFSVNDYHGRLVESFFLFVDLFFVLSGFVISYNYYSSLKSNSDFVIYFIRRVGRVWPAHAVVMILFLIYFIFLLLAQEKSPYTIGASPTTYDLRKFPLVLLLTNSLGMYSGGWNLPSWSISAEIFAYVAFGLAFMAKARLYYSVVLSLIGLLGVVVFGDAQINLTAKYGFLRCLWGFGVGVFTFVLWDRTRRIFDLMPKRNMSLYEFASVAVVVLFLWVSVNPGGNANAISMAAPVVFSALVLVFSHDKGIISKALEGKLMQYLGRLSYSIYINHWIVMLIMASVCKDIFAMPYVHKEMWGGHYFLWDLSNPIVFWISLLVFIFSTICISLISYNLIEDPCRTFVGKFASSLRRKKAHPS
jgi:peptidoglycan/LPS O-acetylase OafA/YrhL